MKTKITALALITATALSLAPKPAAASDKGLAIVGGFLGGLIVASAINDCRNDDYPSRTAVVYNDRCDERRDYRDSDGYWSDVCVRVWVPGCWMVERRHHGCDYRRYVEGHYESRNNRVWVSHDRHEGRNRDSRSGYGDRR